MINITKQTADTDYVPYAVSVRRYLHRHPEQSGHEYGTSGFIRKELTAAGISWKAVGNTGTYAVIEGDPSNRPILLRADIDALPVSEESAYPYASENAGVMHACGHDVHAAALLDAARALAFHGKKLPAPVELIFQQAEEYGHGSQYFIREGLGLDAARVVGFHVDPSSPLGSVKISEGTDAASVDYFHIKIKGKSSHIAMADQGRDSLLATVDLVKALKGLPGEFLNPMDRVLIGIGYMKAGSSWNILADEAEIKGSLRTLSPYIRKKMKGLIDNTVRASALMHDLSISTVWEAFTSSVINDPDVVKAEIPVLEEIFGSSNVKITGSPAMGFAADDFAAFSEKIPGIFIHLGTAESGKPDTSLPLHNSRLLISDRAVLEGSRILQAAAYEYFDECLS